MDGATLTLSAGLLAGCAAAALFAGVSKGGFGSGAAFAPVAVLALAIPPGAALGVMLPVLMAIDVVALRSYWRRWSWADTRPLLLGAVPGVVLGAWLYAQVSDDAIRALIGAVALAFVMWQAFRPKSADVPRSSRAPRALGPVAGIVAGLTSFVSHAGGPPAAMYLLSRGVGKTAYQASTVLLFAAVNLAKFPFFVYLGLFSRETTLANLWMLPFALVGAWLGVRAHHVIPERPFFLVTYVLLGLTGGKLLADGLGLWQ